MLTKKFNDEVLYPDERIVKVSHSQIEDLKAQALKNERKRIRLCTHMDVSDSVHEMLIVHNRDTYVRPHKHIDRMESFHIIEGLCDVILFDEEGNIREVVEMGDVSSGKTFYYRICDAIYHTLIIESETLVFHETTSGPFNREGSVFAPWSPEEHEEEKVKSFINRIKANRNSYES